MIFTSLKFCRSLSFRFRSTGILSTASRRMRTNFNWNKNKTPTAAQNNKTRERKKKRQTINTTSMRCSAIATSDIYTNELNGLLHIFTFVLSKRLVGGLRIKQAKTWYRIVTVRSKFSYVFNCVLLLCAIGEKRKFLSFIHAIRLDGLVCALCPQSNGNVRMRQKSFTASSFIHFH